MPKLIDTQSKALYNGERTLDEVLTTLTEVVTALPSQIQQCMDARALHQMIEKNETEGLEASELLDGVNDAAREVGNAMQNLWNAIQTANAYGAGLR